MADRVLYVSGNAGRGEEISERLDGHDGQFLLEGGLERAVRFVYYGRRAARIASPASRGDDGASGSPEGGEES